MNHRITLVTLACSALLLAGPAAAEVYKCRTADGRVEISNAPCVAGASTVKTAPDEKVSESDRLRAEREVDRMRGYVEQREAAQRTDAALERERQAAAQRQAASATPYGRSTEECLRDLDRQAWQPGQREQMEAACRGNPNSHPVYVPVAVPAYVQPIIGVPRPQPKPEPKPVKPVETPSAVCPPNNKNCYKQ
jgi:hypothetical protein